MDSQLGVKGMNNKRNRKEKNMNMRIQKTLDSIKESLENRDSDNAKKKYLYVPLVVAILGMIATLAVPIITHFLEHSGYGDSSTKVDSEPSQKNNEIQSPLINYAIEPDVSNAFGEYRYALFDISMTLVQAKYFAENLGGHLLTITSEQEQKFVETYLLRYGRKTAYWLGGIHLHKGYFTWITDETTSFTNWIPYPHLRYGNFAYDGDLGMIIYRVTHGDNWLENMWDAIPFAGFYGGFHDLQNMGFIVKFTIN